MTPAMLHLYGSAATTLIAVAWQAALLTLVTAFVLRVVPRLSASARFSTWAALFVILLLLPFAPHAHHGASNTGLHLASWWSVPIALLWVCLSLTRAVQLAAAFLRLRSVSRRARPLPLPMLSPARDARLCLSPDVHRPSVIGFLRPQILIPEALYPRLTAEELEHILLHEQQHLRRGDDWLNLLQKFGLVLFPLNPALLWVERRLCFERELACDESVLTLTGAPEPYARSLVSLAEHTLLSRQLSLALGAWGQRSELTRRVHRILAAHAPALSPRMTAIAVGLLCAGVAGSGAALTRTPRFISFMPPTESAPTVAENTGARFAATPTGFRGTTTLTRFGTAGPQPTLTPALLQLAPRVPPAARLSSRASVQQTAHGVNMRHVAARISRRTLAPLRSSWRMQAIAFNYSQNPLDAEAAAYTLAFGMPSRRPERFHLPRNDRQHSRSSAFALTVLTASQGFPAYAAVPMSNGWLVIEL